MRLVKDYMNNEKLRHELNTLTRTTFGFDFENWVVALRIILHKIWISSWSISDAIFGSYDEYSDFL